MGSTGLNRATKRRRVVGYIVFSLVLALMVLAVVAAVVDLVWG